MAIKSVSVGRGISLNIIQTDKFKTNLLTLNFILPLTRRTAAKNALLPNVLLSGTKKYPTRADINRRLDSLYATSLAARCYKRGEAHIISFAANMLDGEYVTDGCDILSGTADVLRELTVHPLTDESSGAFPRRFVDAEKRNLCDAIRAKINDKRSYALARCTELMCADEAYGVSELGTLDDAEAILPAELYEYYRELLRGARIELFYVGRLPAGGEAALTEVISGIFGGVERAPDAGSQTVATDVVRAPAGQVRSFEETQSISQGKLILGFRTGQVISDDGYEAFTMFAEIFGGSPSSLLFMNVREKLSLCYYCGAYPENYKGVMLVGCGIEAINRDAAQTEILKQLERAKDGDFEERDLENARKSLQNSYMQALDSTGAMEGFYLGRLLVGERSTIEECRGRIGHVTRGAVTEAARSVKLDTIYFLRGSETENSDGEAVVIEEEAYE